MKLETDIKLNIIEITRNNHTQSWQANYIQTCSDKLEKKSKRKYNSDTQNGILKYNTLLIILFNIQVNQCHLQIILPGGKL